MKVWISRVELSRFRAAMVFMMLGYDTSMKIPMMPRTIRTSMRVKPAAVRLLDKKWRSWIVLPT